MAAHTTQARLEACELVGEGIEADGTEVEREGVPGLEVEVGTVAPLGVVTSLEPHAFADLVADRLSGKAEIAIDLAAHEVFREPRALDYERQRQLGRPAL